MKPVPVDGRLVPVCPHCLVLAELRLSPFGRVWVCPVKGCGARVGVHKDSSRAAPLGTLARAPLRALRQTVHSAFDPLWRDVPPRFTTRHEAYAWLAESMAIPAARCHVAEFDDEQCRAALAAIASLSEIAR